MYQNHTINRRGRPPIPQEVKRYKNLHVALQESEFNILRAVADQNRLTLSEVVRALLFKPGGGDERQ